MLVDLEYSGTVNRAMPCRASHTPKAVFLTYAKEG